MLIWCCAEFSKPIGSQKDIHGGRGLWLLATRKPYTPLPKAFWESPATIPNIYQSLCPYVPMSMPSDIARLSGFIWVRTPLYAPPNFANANPMMWSLTKCPSLPGNTCQFCDLDNLRINESMTSLSSESHRTSYLLNFSLAGIAGTWMKKGTTDVADAIHASSKTLEPKQVRVFVYIIYIYL